MHPTDRPISDLQFTVEVWATPTRGWSRYWRQREIAASQMLRITLRSTRGRMHS